MNHPQHDGQLIATSLIDGEVFAIVFDRHFARLHQFVHRRIGPTLADDLVAETFRRAFQNRASFDPTIPDARPWLYAISMNLMRMHHRSESRRIDAYAKSGVDPAEEFTAAADRRVTADAERSALMTGVASLKKADREVLLLHAWAEMSHQEIAETLSIPAGTARSRLARARAHLIERLAASELGPPQPVASGQTGDSDE